MRTGGFNAKTFLTRTDYGQEQPPNEAEVQKSDVTIMLPVVGQTSRACSHGNWRTKSLRELGVNSALERSNKIIYASADMVLIKKDLPQTRSGSGEAALRGSTPQIASPRSIAFKSTSRPLGNIVCCKSHPALLASSPTITSQSPRKVRSRSMCLTRCATTISNLTSTADVTNLHLEIYKCEGCLQAMLKVSQRQELPSCWSR